MTRIEQMNLEAGIIVEHIGGDLRVRGHSSSDLRIEGDEPDIKHETSDAPVTIRCEGDCSIRMPENARLEVRHVGDDATITNLDTDLTIGQIGSDLAVRHVLGNVTVGRVGSDFQAKHIDGDLTVGQIGSDFQAKQIDGHLTVGHVGSDMEAHKITGNLEIEHVGSDLLLRELGGSCDCQEIGSDLQVEMGFDPNQTYRFAASSDVCFVVNADTAAVFLVPIHTEISIDDEEVDAIVEELTDMQRITFGSGGPEVVITDANVFHLTSRSGLYVEVDVDLGERMGRLEERINESLSGLGEMIERQVQQGLAQANEAVQRWTTGKAKPASQARRVERERRHAERQASRMRRHAERVQRHSRHQQAEDWEPPTNEERLLILQMVEEGKISVEEADKLLRALDGN